MYTTTRDQRRADRERTLNRRAERRNKYVPAIVLAGDYIMAVNA